MKKLGIAMIIAVISTGLLFAGGQNEKSVRKASKNLSMYFAWTEDEIPTYCQEFEKDTGIHINYVRLSAGEMITRVISEKGNPQVSIICGGGSEGYINAANEGIFEPYRSPELDNIPDIYWEKDNKWEPVCVAVLCFAVNTEWFKEQKMQYPTTWEALLNPKFKDMVIMAHPSTSGVSSNILTSLVQMLGEDNAFDYFKKLTNIVPYYAKASSSAPSAVSLGEAAIGLTVDSDTLKYQNQGYPIAISFPDPTFVDVNAIALVKNGPADEVENAKIFIDWMLSQRGQNCFETSGSSRMPLNRKAKVSKGLIPLQDIKVYNVDRAVSGRDRKKLISKFITTIDDAQSLK
ncbi:ABC transporter substrate-binding protein [Treponema sp. HNW]|uniref:ABC transporter substrate-binding protein n=1 Tax=Treponema sp. HNW TaxID=3116654 RepID=UPI003D1251FD